MSEPADGTPVIGVLGPLLLGGPNGVVVPVGSGRQRRLLTALALHADRPVPVDQLVDLVWPADPPADPDGAVQTHVARLRRLLPPGIDLHTGPRSYRLRVAADALDVTRFGSALARAAVAADPPSRLTALEQALALCRGRPFAELDGHPAVAAEVARLDGLRESAGQQRAEALLGCGRVGEAVAAAEALVAGGPLAEGAVAVLVRALVAAGRQGDALAAYARLRTRLADELGLEPSLPLRELEERVLRQLPTGSAADPVVVRTAGAPGRRPPGLPTSSFLGRDDALAELTELLGRHRVLTLCGPGGVGKTRLAVHLAARVADRYPDGVLLVDLTAGGPGEVATGLAAALGSTDPRADRPAEAVLAALAVRHQLVVLDNCEHVADELAGLVEAVVAGTARVDLLLTSREPLRVDGERVVAVPPLPPPVAAQLLRDRIRAADPSAVPGADRAELVDRLCRRLDGLPLALELAAGRVATLGLPGLVEALDEEPDGDADGDADRNPGEHAGPGVLDVLRGGRRTAAPRHRSLREVVDWSYALLDDPQRALFDRLAVFAGPVERAAVRAVCRHVDPLPDLVERSLVVRHPGEPARFGMLETLRAYGRSRLATDPSADRLRARHASWAAGLADEVVAGRRGPDEPAAVRRFDDHLADLRRAHARLCATGPTDELLRLTLPFAELAYLRGRVDLVRVLDGTLRAVGDGGAAGDPLAVRLLGLSASVRWMHGDLDGARDRAERAVALAERHGDPTAARDAYDALANVASFRGDLTTAIAHATTAARLSAAAGDAEVRVLALTDLVLVHAYAGDDAGAGRYEAELDAVATALGSPTAAAWSAYARGERRAESGDPDAAEHLIAAVRAADRVGSGFIAGVARHTLLTSTARAGADPAAALPGFGPLIDHWHGFGAWSQLWIAIRALVETLSRLGRHRDAAVLLGALRASPRASPPFGTDAVRVDEVERAAREALGSGFADLLARGAALGDTAAVALARRMISG